MTTSLVPKKTLGEQPQQLILLGGVRSTLPAPTTPTSTPTTVIATGTSLLPLPAKSFN